mmetsp:Transcript_115097/g.203997  ORF Transcript_115097/g.203997 Transcript_115097/m.203997 type:complete len:367 (-) Transcript_115097:213-1313(-)
MAQYMKSDGEEQVCWDRQLSAASTTLPSSPPMSRMVSPEVEQKVNESTAEIKDGVESEFSALPDEVYNATPSKEVLAFLPVLCGLVIYGLLNSMSARILMEAVALLMLVPALYLCVVNGCSLDHAWPQDSEEEGNSRLENSADESEREEGVLTEETKDDYFECCALPDSVMAMIFLPVTCGIFIYGVLNSVSSGVLAAALAALILLPGFCLSRVGGFCQERSGPEDFKEEGECRPEDCKEEDNDSQKTCGTAARSWLSLIIGSFYDVCVYMSFFVFLGAVAILSPWALMLLPPIYLCLRDDHRTEDCEEEDNDSQKPKDAPASSFLTLGFSSLFGTCIYTIISVFVGGVAILAIILPTALVFCLQD